MSFERILSVIKTTRAPNSSSLKVNESPCQFKPVDQEGGECCETDTVNYKNTKSTQMYAITIENQPANGECGECCEVEKAITVISSVRIFKLKKRDFCCRTPIGPT